MKRIFMSAAVILLTTAAVHAQSDSTTGPRREHRQMQKDRGFEDLNLTTDQQAKLKGLRDDFKKQADELKSQKLTEDERRTKMQALRDAQRTQMNAILTPEQKAQMDKRRAEHKDHIDDRKGWNGDSTKMRNHDNRQGRADMQKELNLTSDQQAKLKSIRADFKKEADALRNDNALTQEQRRTKLHDLMEQQREQMKRVLTKEQQDKMSQFRKDRRSNEGK